MVHVATVGAHLDLEVDAAGIREFAAATRSRAVEHTRAEAPVVPPTFLPARLAPAGEPTAADHWPGVPVEQDYRFFGPPPRAGERLTAQSRIERVYEAFDDNDSPVTMVAMVTQYFDPTGRLVAESWMTGTRPAGQEPA